MKLKVIRTTAVRIIIWFFVTSIGSVLLFRWLPVPVTPLMLIRCCEQSMDGKAIRLDKKWKSLDEMGVAMPKAVIASEDQKFEEHFGFDLEAIRKARKYNERHSGKKMKGASTISQQTAKNLFLWPSRSWVRKGFEVYFTFLIELIWSKERILEVYLNIIEMGDGIYGAEAASQTYFRKSCEKISSHEAALIAAVLPNPRRWSPARPSAYIRRRAGAIHQMMSKVNYGLE